MRRAHRVGASYSAGHAGGISKRSLSACRCLLWRPPALEISTRCIECLTARWITRTGPRTATRLTPRSMRRCNPWVGCPKACTSAYRRSGREGPSKNLLKRRLWVGTCSFNKETRLEAGAKRFLLITSLIVLVVFSAVAWLEHPRDGIRKFMCDAPAATYDALMHPRTGIPYAPKGMSLKPGWCAPGDVGLDLIEGQAVRLGPSHTISGNPMRFRHGLVPLRLDDAWKEGMPGRRKAVGTAMTFPWLVRYGYVGRSP